MPWDIVPRKKNMRTTLIQVHILSILIPHTFSLVFTYFQFNSRESRGKILLELIQGHYNELRNDVLNDVAAYRGNNASLCRIGEPADQIEYMVDIEIFLGVQVEIGMSCKRFCKQFLLGYSVYVD